MSTQEIETYKGREQALIKHMLLRRYLVKLFMILGQRETVINFVDCFAGPWQSEMEDRSDTSFGIAHLEMIKCFDSLQEMFDRKVKFRALFIENDAVAYQKLDSYVKSNAVSRVELSSIKGEFLKLIPQIQKWAAGGFTFFFVDPLGWKDVSAPRMEPLLRLPRTEFLINFMYDFANRGFAQPDKFESHILELLGYVPDLTGLSTTERQLRIINLYRAKLKTAFGEEAYSSFLPVERPGQNRILYYLVYLSRHPSGIDAFKKEAEKTEEFQQQIQLNTKLQKKAAASGIDDIFSSGGSTDSTVARPRNNEIAISRAAILNLLADGPVKIDMATWARLLEQNQCLPADFQAAIRDLVINGIVSNLDTSIKRRRTNVLVPKNEERWIRLSDS